MIQKNRSGKKSTGSAKTKRKSVSKSKTSAVCRKKSSRKSGKNSRVRQRNLRMLLICIILMVGVSIGCWYGINNMQERERKEQEVLLEQENSGSGPEQWQKEGAPYIDVELLTPNEYSRPQIPIESVKYIAIHYTANPGATAMANRNYFENLANTHETKVSSHFVIGLDGEGYSAFLHRRCLMRQIPVMWIPYRSSVVTRMRRENSMMQPMIRL